ncbi:MAG TPA: hypothetical protein VFQ23_26295 [Anaerolineales bacterium]|nr:hypothetical protein [Anaerolineales bacterium]
MLNPEFASSSTFGILFLIFVLSNMVLMHLIFVTYDSLLKLEYNFYRMSWESDGQPFGFFGIDAKDQSLQISLPAFLRKQYDQAVLSIKWLFSTPSWMVNDIQALQLVSKYRWLMLIWIIFGAIPTFVLIITVF